MKAKISPGINKLRMELIIWEETITMDIHQASQQALLKY